MRNTMNPRVKNVSPNNDYTINITFDNGEERIFDVSPYLDKGIFKELLLMLSRKNEYLLRNAASSMNT